ncbi:hypothetical protein [Nocardia sp. alder85J]|uniref:hypothetical protein n=1 Tax=Nocardia sp. alder85J TaxID=2862949 RepID=UPI001CD58EE1|nr:hypothetical protein [Nocardia sp. alder85J]MCX4093796.1 hypothetical protein [Nocardia sp. alder85J]
MDESVRRLLDRLAAGLARIIPRASGSIAERYDEFGDLGDRAAGTTTETEIRAADEIGETMRPGAPVSDESSGARPHPLRGLWLERKVPADSADPFTSIMDLPHDEAAAVAERMGKRIENADYVDTRTQAEAWLRSHAAMKGSPSAHSPLYFKLVSEQGTYPAQEGSVVIRIPADSIPAEHLTLTVEDSFFNYQMVAGTPASNLPEGLVPRVVHGVDADTALALDTTHRDYLDAARPGRYIEAQVWSRDAPILAVARAEFRAGIPADRVITVRPGSADGHGPTGS